MLFPQFLNEASLAGKLRHPHIVAILDAVVEADSGYIAMEIVSGGDLAQFVKPDKLLPVEDVLQIGFKCCGALDYAFSQGIVHRDIKPANIMIVQGTDVKIADFVSRTFQERTALEKEGTEASGSKSPEDFAAFIAEDAKLWARLVKDSGAKAD